jgi:hypothetical protein
VNKPLQRHPFFIRLFNWEYWPFALVYTPVFVYWFLLALKNRSLLFFTAANPGIPTGGLVGESKREIMAAVPWEWKPRETYLPALLPQDEALKALNKADMSFPCVLKPDVGERGLLVRVVDDADMLWAFRREPATDYILQEYVAFPEEVAVLYHRLPGEKRGHVSSVTLKEYLFVEGDGHRTLAQLIEDKPRALLQRDALSKSHGHRWHEVLPAGERLQFHTIGNHSKGTKFISGQHRIDERLIQRFDAIADTLPGIHFARFDIKCRSWEALLEGEDFRIMEINGVKSEPAHIYDPDYPIWKFYRDLFAQWTTIDRISRANRKAGVPYMRHRTAWRRLQDLRRYHKSLKAAGTVPEHRAMETGMPV